MAAGIRLTDSLMALYERAVAVQGESHWWPGETPFEVAVGAILTQNTNWGNVERAIANLRGAQALTEDGLSALSTENLAELIRPAGYFRVKAKRLQNFMRFLETEGQGRMEGLTGRELDELRPKLLAVNGVGPETCDSILLYALNLPVFVVDAYTARMLSRHGYIAEGALYHDIQDIFSGLPTDAKIFNEFHAQFVRVGKDYCRPRNQRCPECPWSYDLNR